MHPLITVQSPNIYSQCQNAAFVWRGSSSQGIFLIPSIPLLAILAFVWHQGFQTVVVSYRVDLKV